MVTPLKRRAASRTPCQHVNAVGSSVHLFRKVDDAVVARTKFYADLANEVLLGRKLGRQSDSEITFFKSLGIIAEDLTAADYAVARAIEENHGAHVSFD